MAETAPKEHSKPDYAAIATMTGLEFVAGLADDSIAPPSMVRTFPFTLLPPGQGNVELRTTPDDRALNLMMTAHGGWIMTMMDTAMALAAHTTLDPGQMAPTHETSVKFIRPITRNAGVLRFTGLVLSRGQSVITIEGKVEDLQGKVFAHGTSTCLIVRTGA